MFIVFEGIDGTGKSTQAKMLADSLQGGFLTAEPTKGPIGKLIRERLYSGQTDLHVMRRLFAADRHEHVSTVVLPVQEEGGIVVSDRYLLSSLAYQSGPLGTKSHINDILRINEQGKSLPKPDLTIFLDMVPERLVERLQARGRELDSFETVEHLTGVRKRYRESLNRVRSMGWAIEEISADGTIEYVHRRVIEVVSSRLGDKLGDRLIWDR